MWDTLGIKPTKDIKEIKRAYARLAKKFNPEEHPDRFRKIYDAYKAACFYAKSSDYQFSDEQVTKHTSPAVEKESSYAFDFSSVNDCEEAIEAIPYNELKAYLLNTIKNYTADKEKKNNCTLWKKFFSSEQFERFYFESDFRRKASDIIFCETFTPEAASVIASGFGRGSKAIPSRAEPLTQWMVEISNCTGKVSPKVEPLNSPKFIYKDMTMKELVILIAVLILLMSAAAAYSSWHVDQFDYGKAPAETTVTQDNSPPYVYTDFVGNLYISDEPPQN
ncbi:MAG: DnaJ domain-containing protein [Oscillospiraceae bacterium]|nr:DnaJ domain-containing protein [Oscillospiraceae bacterium]